jgi:hypothetical protein
MGGRENTRSTLDADLHAGLWGSIVQPLAGATGYWWWLHLHFDKCWGEYQPVARFMQGEDLRPSARELALDPVELPAASASPLHARALKSDQRMYAWVYQQQLPLGGPAGDISDGTLSNIGLPDGTYSVEFWNTRTGMVIQKSSMPLTRDGSIKLPVFKGDIAIKIKRP